MGWRTDIEVRWEYGNLMLLTNSASIGTINVAHGRLCTV